MIKRTITYKDPWTSESTTADFYFHFTEAELMRLNNAHKDLRGEIARISNGDASNAEIILLFEEFISKSYGERTKEGRFVKSQEITDAFLVSEPYSALIVSFFDGPEGGRDGGDFLSSLMPADLVAKAEARQAEEDKKDSDQPSEERIAELKERLRRPASEDVVVDAEIVEE
jgi:hypothetical protein